MSYSNTYDVIVIGAGAMGSAAAYHLGKMGSRVLLLDQYQLDHQLGSSYGYSRIIRYSYDHPAYIALMKGAYPLWHALEAEAGESLMIKTGGLDFGKPDHPRFRDTRLSMEASEVEFDVLTPAETHQRFPQFRLDDDMEALYQADSGMLRASRCVIAQARLAQARYGATFLDQTQVHRLSPTAEGVIVATSRGEFSAGSVVVAAGSWTKPLLETVDWSLPLQPTREQLVFFRAEPAADYEVPNFPIFIAWGDLVFYGIGSVDGTGFKTTQHGIHEAADPNTMKRTADQELIERVHGFLQRHIPGAAGEVISSRVCLYTMTPDEHFIFDQHPAHPQIVVGAGFSGHGFKFSTLVGQILGQMARGEAPPYDLSLFAAQRFVSTVDKL